MRRCARRQVATAAPRNAMYTMMKIWTSSAERKVVPKTYRPTTLTKLNSTAAISARPRSFSSAAASPSTVRLRLESLAEEVSMERRRILKGAAAALGLAGLRDALGAAVNVTGSMAELGFTEIPDGALAEQLLHALPGKVPLIKKSFRPPNYETPIEYFRTPMTANRAFFVRWHLAAIPQVALKDWKLAVGGESAERQLNFTMNELRKEF